MDTSYHPKTVRLPIVLGASNALRFNAAPIEFRTYSFPITRLLGPRAAGGCAPTRRRTWVCIYAAASAPSGALYLNTLLGMYVRISLGRCPCESMRGVSCGVPVFASAHTSRVDQLSTTCSSVRRLQILSWKGGVELSIHARMPS